MPGPDNTDPRGDPPTPPRAQPRRKAWQRVLSSRDVPPASPDRITSLHDKSYVSLPACRAPGVEKRLRPLPLEAREGGEKKEKRELSNACSSFRARGNRSRAVRAAGLVMGGLSLISTSQRGSGHRRKLSTTTCADRERLAREQRKETPQEYRRQWLQVELRNSSPYKSPPTSSPLPYPTLPNSLPGHERVCPGRPLSYVHLWPSAWSRRHHHTLHYKNPASRKIAPSPRPRAL